MCSVIFKATSLLIECIYFGRFQVKTIKFNLNLNSTLLALTMAGVLTACGGGGGAETPDSVDETEESSETPSPTPTPAPAPAPAPNPAGTTGKVLWSSHCASCHGGDYGKGVNAGEIMSAIASNKGGMSILNGVINLDKASQIAVFTSSPSSY